MDMSKISKEIIKKKSYERGIIVSTVLNILAKLIVFLNTIVITYYFGTQIETDIYYYVIIVTTLICSSINGIDLLVLIPEIMRLRQQESESDARQFTNFFIFLYILIGFLFAMLIMINPINFYSTFSKFDTEKLERYELMLNIGIGIIFFQLINSFLSSVLTSYKFFISPILANIVNSLFTILFTFFFHSHLGIKATLLGVLLGYVINFVILTLTLRFQLHWRFTDFSLMKNVVVWKNIGLMQLNFFPVWLRSYISILLLSEMATGTITALNIAQNVAAIPEAFIVTQVVAIIGIKFSELNALSDFITLKNLLNNVLISLLLLIIPVAIVFGVCSKDIISILYLRGGFDSQALANTSFCLVYLSILMPSKIPDALFTRLFTSLQLYKVTVFSATLAHIIISTLTYFLTTKFGISGYFWTLLIGYWVIMPIVYFLIIFFKAKTFRSFIVLKNLAYISIITSLVTTVAYYNYSYNHSVPYINLIVTIIIVIIPFWLLSYYTLDIEPIKIILRNFFFKIKVYKK